MIVVEQILGDATTLNTLKEAQQRRLKDLQFYQNMVARTKGKDKWAVLQMNKLQAEVNEAQKNIQRVQQGKEMIFSTGVKSVIVPPSIKKKRDVSTNEGNINWIPIAIVVFFILLAMFSKSKVK